MENYHFWIFWFTFSGARSHWPSKVSLLDRKTAIIWGFTCAQRCQSWKEWWWFLTMIMFENGHPGDSSTWRSKRKNSQWWSLALHGWWFIHISGQPWVPMGNAWECTLLHPGPAGDTMVSVRPLDCSASLHVRLRIILTLFPKMSSFWVQLALGVLVLVVVAGWFYEILLDAGTPRKDLRPTFQQHPCCWPFCWYLVLAAWQLHLRFATLRFAHSRIPHTDTNTCTYEWKLGNLVIWTATCESLRICWFK